MSDSDRALQALVKAQNTIAEASWDVVRVQSAVKDSDATLTKMRTNLSDAHVRYSKMQREVEGAMETWRLAVIREHKPDDTSIDPPASGEVKL